MGDQHKWTIEAIRRAPHPVDDGKARDEGFWSGVKTTLWVQAFLIMAGVILYFVYVRQ